MGIHEINQAFINRNELISLASQPKLNVETDRLKLGGTAVTVM